MINKKVKRSFDVPTQVAFYDAENNRFIGGIGYGDEIICLECGATFEIDDYLDEIEETCPDVAFPIIVLPWVSIHESCLGDMMFDVSTGEAV